MEGVSVMRREGFAEAIDAVTATEGVTSPRAGVAG
jgi:hypothetical protein